MALARAPDARTDVWTDGHVRMLAKPKPRCSGRTLRTDGRTPLGCVRPSGRPGTHSPPGIYLRLYISRLAPRGGGSLSGLQPNLPTGTLGPLARRGARKLICAIFAHGSAAAMLNRAQRRAAELDVWTLGGTSARGAPATAVLGRLLLLNWVPRGRVAKGRHAVGPAAAPLISRKADFGPCARPPRL